MPLNVIEIRASALRAWCTEMSACCGPLIEATLWVIIAGGTLWVAAAYVVIVFSVLGEGDWCAGWRGCGPTGGVASSTPVSPAEKLEADFRPASRRTAPWGSWIGPKMPPEPHGRSASERQQAEAETGRARRAWVDGDGAPSVTLGAR